MAVRAAGGNQVVATRADMNLSTLNRYIAGRDMKASAMIRLARACNVSLDWLATGQESTAPAAQPPSAQPAPPPASQPPDLFSIVNVDKMVGCLEAAMHDMPPKFGKLPMRKVVQVALVLYDALTAQDAEEKATGKVMTTTDAPPGT